MRHVAGARLLHPPDFAEVRHVRDEASVAGTISRILAVGEVVVYKTLQIVPEQSSRETWLLTLPFRGAPTVSISDRCLRWNGRAVLTRERVGAVDCPITKLGGLLL
ncbi:MAG: hypothetical protein WBP81_35085 [Solirubrobacteraceae bacterium]